jgi:hypothetical protein
MVRLNEYGPAVNEWVPARFFSEDFGIGGVHREGWADDRLTISGTVEAAGRFCQLRGAALVSGPWRIKPRFPETHKGSDNRPYYHPLNPYCSSKSK